MEAVSEQRRGKPASSVIVRRCGHCILECTGSSFLKEQFAVAMSAGNTVKERSKSVQSVPVRKDALRLCDGHKRVQQITTRMCHSQHVCQGHACQGYGPRARRGHFCRISRYSSALDRNRNSVGTVVLLKSRTRARVLSCPLRRYSTQLNPETHFTHRNPSNVPQSTPPVRHQVQAYVYTTSDRHHRYFSEFGCKELNLYLSKA